MSNQTSGLRTPWMLSAGLAALMAVQAVLGLLLQASYNDADWIKAAWLGNDAVTLVLAVPLLVIAMTFARRGSMPGVLSWLGLIGYAAYNYTYYLLGAALNVFFPLYVVAVVSAVILMILTLTRVDAARLASSFRSTTPVRIIGGYFAFVGLGLASVWITMWAAYVFAHRPLPVAPEAFKLVAALDISLMATSLTLGGVLLWQRHIWGYVISAIAGIQGSLYLSVLSVNSIIAIHRGIAKPPGELPVWGTLALLTTAFTVLLLANVRHRRPHPKAVLPTKSTLPETA